MKLKTEFAPSAEPAFVVLPKKRTTKPVLQLLADLGAGAVMVTTISPEGVRGYRLAPSGRCVRTTAAERAIALQLIVPGNDGLFGPDTRTGRPGRRMKIWAWRRDVAKAALAPTTEAAE